MVPCGTRDRTLDRSADHSCPARDRRRASPSPRYTVDPRGAEDAPPQIAAALRGLTGEARALEWDKESAPSPYPGLLSFDERRAGVFFGRREEILAIIERLTWRHAEGAERLVVVAGPSGSGKSSRSAPACSRGSSHRTTNGASCPRSPPVARRSSNWRGSWQSRSPSAARTSRGGTSDNAWTTMTMPWARSRATSSMPRAGTVRTAASCCRSIRESSSSRKPRARTGSGSSTCWWGRLRGARRCEPSSRSAPSTSASSWNPRRSRVVSRRRSPSGGSQLNGLRR